MVLTIADHIALLRIAARHPQVRVACRPDGSWEAERRPTSTALHLIHARTAAELADRLDAGDVRP